MFRPRQPDRVTTSPGSGRPQRRRPGKPQLSREQLPVHNPGDTPIVAKARIATKDEEEDQLSTETETDSDEELAFLDTSRNPVVDRDALKKVAEWQTQLDSPMSGMPPPGPPSSVVTALRMPPGGRLQLPKGTHFTLAPAELISEEDSVMVDYHPLSGSLGKDTPHLSVHLSGRLLAYTGREGRMKSEEPSPRKEDLRQTGLLHLVHMSSGQGIHLSGMRGKITDVALSDDCIEQGMIIAAVDEIGHISLHEVQGSKDLFGTLKAKKLLDITVAEDNVLPTEQHKVVWCPGEEEEEEGVLPHKRILAVISNSVVDVFDVTSLVEEYGGGQSVPLRSIEVGRVKLLRRQHLFVRALCLNPADTIAAIATDDGTIKIVDYGLLDAKEDSSKTIHTYAPFRPEPGHVLEDGPSDLTISSMNFLDDAENGTWARMVVGAKGNTVLHLVETVHWTCVQTLKLNFTKEAPAFSLSVDPAGCFILLGQIRQDYHCNSTVFIVGLDTLSMEYVLQVDLTLPLRTLKAISSEVSMVDGGDIDLIVGGFSGVWRCSLDVSTIETPAGFTVSTEQVPKLGSGEKIVRRNLGEEISDISTEADYVPSPPVKAIKKETSMMLVTDSDDTNSQISADVIVEGVVLQPKDRNNNDIEENSTEASTIAAPVDVARIEAKLDTILARLNDLGMKQDNTDVRLSLFESKTEKYLVGMREESAEEVEDMAHKISKQMEKLLISVDQSIVAALKSLDTRAQPNCSCEQRISDLETSFRNTIREEMEPLMELALTFQQDGAEDDNLVRERGDGNTLEEQLDELITEGSTNEAFAFACGKKSVQLLLRAMAAVDFDMGVAVKLNQIVVMSMISFLLMDRADFKASAAVRVPYLLDLVPALDTMDTRVRENSIKVLEPGQKVVKALIEEGEGGRPLQAQLVRLDRVMRLSIGNQVNRGNLMTPRKN